MGGLENFSKINKRGGGTIIRYSRVGSYIRGFTVNVIQGDLSFRKAKYLHVRILKYFFRPEHSDSICNKERGVGDSTSSTPSLVMTN